MKLIIAAVGTRVPHWVVAGYENFARRMPRELKLELIEVKAEPRNCGKPVETILAIEAQRLRGCLPAHARIIALDERGADIATVTLAQRLETWLTAGDDVAFLIGGPDGLETTLKRQADESLRLSSLTLPHALVRVLLAEALYRASSLIKGHPYHRA